MITIVRRAIYIFYAYYIFRILFALYCLIAALLQLDTTKGSDYHAEGILYNSLLFGSYGLVVLAIYLVLCWFLQVGLRSRLV